MTTVGWTLHSGRRSFGPLTEDELRAYFRAHMVKADDRIDAPGRDAPLSATEVAAMLGIEGQLPSAPKPYEPPRAANVGFGGRGVSPDAVVAGSASPQTRPPPAVAPDAGTPPPTSALPPPPSARLQPPVEQGPAPRWPLAVWILALFAMHVVLAPRLFPDW